MNLCTAIDCDKPIFRKVLCQQHWRRAEGRIKKDFNAPISKILHVGCKVEWCDRPHFAKGFCQQHLRRKNGSSKKQMNEPFKKEADSVKYLPCEEDGCDQTQKAKGRCINHHRAYVTRTRKEKLIKMKGGRCQKCKQTFPYFVYDFHHRNPQEKDFNIGQGIHKNWEEILDEIEKCDLLCANCHRFVTADLRGR